jgi:hypothetical protein
MTTSSLLSLTTLLLATTTSASALYTPNTGRGGGHPVGLSGISVELKHTPHGMKRENEEGSIVDWVAKERARTEAKYKFGAYAKGGLGKRADTTIT